MQYWAPLVQTILWVILVGGIFWRFNKPINSILEGLAERIKTGSDITAGPFSLKRMQPLQPNEQAARAMQEIAEANNVAHLAASDFVPTTDIQPVESSENMTVHVSSSTPIPAQAAAPAPAPAPTPAPTLQFRARYFQAEDLAIRAVQSEFGQPINRQVKISNGHAFDGAFDLNHELHVVEVKYYSKPPPNEFLANLFLHLQSLSELRENQRAQVILAVVVDRAEDVPTASARLALVAARVNSPATVRVYDLENLQREFGVT